MKMIQILTVGILAFALNTYAGDLESEVSQIRRILSDAESQRRDAEFQAHMNAGFQQAANYHAQQEAKQAAILAGPARVIVVGQPIISQPNVDHISTTDKPTANQIAEYKARRYGGTLEEVNQLQAMFIAMHNSGAIIDSGLLHEAVYHPQKASRASARNRIFKSIRIQARSR